jgi:hypothetical protein
MSNIALGPSADGTPAVRQLRVGRWLSRRLILGACVAIALLGIGGAAPTEEYTIELGPFDLPAHSGHQGLQQPKPLALELPVDGWMRGLSYEVVDAQGNQLPNSLLHHLNLIAPDYRELFSDIMLRVGAFGSETKPYGVPFFLGYRIHPGDSLLVTAMLHNPTGRPISGAKLRVQLELSPARSWVRPVAVRPVYLDVMPPAGTHAFDLPPGRSSKSWEGRPAVAARLLAAGTHMHQYGTALRLEDVSAGKLIWEARPERGPKGEVLGMPTKYFLPFGVPLHPDHIYRLTAEYDNPTGKVLVDGGMGALGGVVVPTSDDSWPGVARSDSVYQHDVRVTTGDGAAHHHQAPNHTPAHQH